MRNLPWILVGALTLALLMSWCGGEHHSSKRKNDTVWLPIRIDTIHDTLIGEPVVEKPAGSEVNRLPVVGAVKPKLPAAVPSPEPEVKDSTGKDSAEVLIPIVQREYQTDDYRIVVSGYNPRLNEVEIYRHTQTAVVNSRKRNKHKRWGIGPCVGVGIGPKGTPGVFLGVSVQFSLLQW